MTIHDGALYVTSVNSNPQSVQRFDATTGVHTGQFVPTIANPSPRETKVNPANNRLYVLYYNKATVETFDLTTMASYGLLMPVGSPIGSGGLYTPSAMAFGPDGNLYISGGSLEGISASDVTTQRRERSSTFLSTPGAISTSQSKSRSAPIKTSMSPLRAADNVMRFNYPGGTFMDFFVPDGGGGLTAPFHLTFTVGTSSTLTYTLHRNCLDNVEEFRKALGRSRGASSWRRTSTSPTTPA